MLGAIERTSYDEVPYLSHPFRQTHPDRLATIGHLFGMQPVPIDRCRVLEIGCANGDNLLPMAFQLPDSDFVGIDLSNVQIAAADSKAREFGVENLTFLRADLCALPSNLGEFDYIISHGVYSWIPDHAQRALLDVCCDFLSPNGISYVSYNTFPGWHMRGMIRDMMNYRVRKLTSPTERIQRARELLRFLASSVPLENNAYGILLNGESNLLSRQNDSYLFHEHLEEHNSPLYFYQFVERAETAGLQYLGEADFSMMFVEGLPSHVEAGLRTVATTLVEAEQYMDFVRNRTFRQTLLCRQSVVLDRSLPSARILPLFISSPTRPESTSYDIENQIEMQFRRGESIAATSDPLTKAALIQLGESWPRRLSFPDVLDAAHRKLTNEALSPSGGVVDDSFVLAQALLGCYANGHIDLSVRPSTCEVRVSEKPVASQLARAQAARTTFVTNEFHTDVELREYERYVMQMLDGQHDCNEITNKLMQLVERGKLQLRPEICSSSSVQLRQLVMQTVTDSLTRFASNGLLVD